MQAEQIQAKADPTKKLLYLGNGQRYCDLLLTLRSPIEVMNRLDATEDLENSDSDKSHLSDGLRALNRGRALTLRKIGNELEVAERNLTSAIMLFQQAGRQDFVPRALIARAVLNFNLGQTGPAQADLEEAWHIAEYGKLILIQGDIHLCRALFFHNKEELKVARTHREKHGYWKDKNGLETAESDAKRWKHRSVSVSVK